MQGKKAHKSVDAPRSVADGRAHVEGGGGGGTRGQEAERVWMQGMTRGYRPTVAAAGGRAGVYVRCFW